MKSREEVIFLSFNNFHDEPFGPGWAWDDYVYAFQPEKAPLPLFGNVVTISKGPGDEKLSVTPVTFQKFLSPDYNSDSRPYFRRQETDNVIKYAPLPDSSELEIEIPFTYNNEIVRELLTDTLNRSIEVSNRSISKEAVTIHSIPADSVYRRMMQDSDNFLAEQILLMVSGILSDSLKTSIAIDYSKKHLLADLPDEPVWVDGSGLSRYNLFTPRSIVILWDKMYRMVSRERLFAMLATGGKSGTLENWYKSDTPYIYGKTGTLRNNHCLSGFLLTKKGSTLIFSFMNNNYNSSSSNIKKEMEKILWQLHEKY